MASLTTITQKIITAARGDTKIKSKAVDMKRQADEMIRKYEDRLPVWIEKNKSCKRKDIKNVVKHKYLTPKTLRCAELMAVVRRRIDISPQVALFLFVSAGKNGGMILLPSSWTVEEAWTHYKSPDNFLRVKYDAENTFG